MAFKVGDKVQLKSGGPAMTVSGIQSDGRVMCTWFDKDQKLEHAGFSSDTLRPYEDEEPVAPFVA